MAGRKLILITPGDPEGIGPEIVVKCRSQMKRRRDFRFACVGAVAPFKKMRVKTFELTEEQLRSGEDFPEQAVAILAAPTHAPLGRLLAGYQSGWAIEKATQLIRQGLAHALVTGPISKDRLQRGGFPYSGHTDFLAALCGVDQVTMMLANDLLRISLATVHIGLQQVPEALTREKIRRAVLQTAESLQNWWKIRKPRIAIAGLNPHAGEGGLFGDEEIRVISPEIKSLEKVGVARDFTVSGPYPADTLFATNSMARPKDRYDAIVCMYHDQGLIPVKLLDFRRTVNVTLGLPIVRTSVDHGTAFDLVGKNKADPSSLQSAIELAVEILKRKTQEK